MWEVRTHIMHGHSRTAVHARILTLPGRSEGRNFTDQGGTSHAPGVKRREVFVESHERVLLRGTIVNRTK